MHYQFMILSLLSFVVTTSSIAQTVVPVPLAKTFASSMDVTNIIAKAKANKKEGQAIVVEPILALAPYKANLEYRTLVGPAAIHEKEAEFFYVIDGKGTMVIGGTLVNESRQNAENLSGTGIEGGSTTALAKGDFLVIPQNTAHWVNSVDGTLVLMSLHVPRQ
jgi:mannose-6-phosphate isomerase-like protein (cupin superfamily)